MTKIRTMRNRIGIPAVAALALLAAGCGTERPGDAVDAAAPPPTAAADLPCPAESPTPTRPKAASPSDPATPPTDHYAENHGFRVPIPLHGRQRCEGLAAVKRIEKALEPLRKRGDFTPGSTRGALTGLGYPTGKVQVSANGSAAVGFLVDASPMCVEGTMNGASTRAEAFAGYPDHTGCDVPSGGH